MASYGIGTSNAFALLGDEAPPAEQGNKKQASTAAPTPKVERQEQKPRIKTEDRQKLGGQQRVDAHTGASRGGRGGRGGGRGGHPPREGQRQFDRRGAPQQKAPGAPRKGGFGLGEAGQGGDHGALHEPIHHAEPKVTTVDESFDAVEPAGDAAADGAEPSADGIVIDEAATIDFDNLEPAKLSYDEFVAQQKAKAVAEDAERKLREPENDEKKWKKIAPLAKKEEDAVIVVEKQQKETKSENREKKSKKNVVSLDEFVGERPAARPFVPREEYKPREPRGDAPAGDRPARGGFDATRGGGRGRGRGGFDPSRGRGRGGFEGRGRGRGGYRGRGDAHINTSDESAFPKLGGK